MNWQPYLLNQMEIKNPKQFKFIGMVKVVFLYKKKKNLLLVEFIVDIYFFI